MKKMTKRIISLLLTVCICFLATVPVFAAGEDEEYLADLRIIYADGPSEALEILENSDLEGYKLFDANLNENTGKSGVYLAYLTTTDIEEAITDISVMQMNGGYNEGNYQEMIKQSLAEYEAMGANYLTAIDYFKKGYNAGNYLSNLAFRQLNFYNVVTEGIDDIPDFEGERLGDIFLEGIEVSDLATMFMQGNSYALNNVRSLLAMGVSYNADGKTYLEHVAIEAEKMTANPNVYANENYDELASMIAIELSYIRNMLKELEAKEPDINWEDEEISELEMQYLDVKLVSVMLGQVAYTADKTLYDFVIEYVYNENDYSALYPLVAALNDGQIAMTKVAHYYDVVRYSMTLETNEDLEKELAKAEAEYNEYPFNIYEGVDRTIYYDTFALTSAAYRADAFTEAGLEAALFQGGEHTVNMVFGGIGAVGSTIFAAGLLTHAIVKIPVWKASIAYSSARSALFKLLDEKTLYLADRCNKIYDTLAKAGYNLGHNFKSWSLEDKFNAIYKFYSKRENFVGASSFKELKSQLSYQIKQNDETAKLLSGKADAIKASLPRLKVVYGMYIVGGLMTLVSAVKLGIDIYNYYHPTYDDIPTAMVDLIETKDGDRYIKYDVVYEAEPKSDGTFVAADLNAFSANRWNAMYYTKSYEAGKPLLADEFVISTNNNTPAEKHAAVHRFGEVVCYNLNKYNFNDDHSIYLSVKQSDNQKAAVERVPEIIGSVFSPGYLILAGGVGIAAGVGGTVGAIEIIKRRKNKTAPEAELTEEVTE